MRAFINHLQQMDYEQVTAWIFLLVLIGVALVALHQAIKYFCAAYVAMVEARALRQLAEDERNRERLQKHLP